MKHWVGRVEEIQENEPHIINIDGIEIGVIRSGTQYYAARNVCPHKLAPVCKGHIVGTMLPCEPGEFQFGLEGKVLKCPWHGWEFDLESGKALFGISSKQVRTFRVEINDGDMYVHI